MTTTNPEKEHKIEIEKLKDDGRVNNYSEFEIKAKMDLQELDLWKYIEGPESTAPEIPTLQAAPKVTGIDDDTMSEVTLTIPGNEQEVEAAVKAREPVMNSRL